METISAGAQKLKKGLRQNKICHFICKSNGHQKNKNSSFSEFIVQKKLNDHLTEQKTPFQSVQFMFNTKTDSVLIKKVVFWAGLFHFKLLCSINFCPLVLRTKRNLKFLRLNLALESTGNSGANSAMRMART